MTLRVKISEGGSRGMGWDDWRVVVIDWGGVFGLFLDDNNPVSDRPRETIPFCFPCLSFKTKGYCPYIRPLRKIMLFIESLKGSNRVLLCAKTVAVLRSKSDFSQIAITTY